MKAQSNWIYKAGAALLCAVLAVAVAPFAASADLKSKVQIQIGKPSVWSMAQAHYLLAKMHKDNRALATRMPTDAQLDPNAINTTRIQLLRTLLDVEAQYSQKVGVENQAKLREDQFAVNQREEARAELADKTAELDTVNADLRRLNKTEDRKKEELRRATEDRQAQETDNDKPNKTEKDLTTDLANLDARIKAKEDRKSELQDEIGPDTPPASTPATGTAAAGSATTPASTSTGNSTLRQRASAPVAPPSLSEVSVGASAALPDFNSNLKDIIGNAFKDSGKPSLAASIALDNFVGMQYEIIAKRLTLLRDEVGPDERVIFLELPSSIYTVPCKGDDYIAQVHWKVNWYYDDKQAEASMADENRESPTNIEDILSSQVDLKVLLAELESKRKPDPKEKPTKKTARQIATAEAESKMRDQQIDSVKRQLDLISRKVDEEKWKAAFTSNIRALDIIPRQSALNVNEVQDTVSQTNFMGVLKLLVGFGLRVSYQRQRELYEQYLQQEVFASGFGKGSNAFGWTFGALPGTNRVAPGVRTTYAVLAVPRDASALKIDATGVAYHRKSAPDYDLDESRYDPNSKQILDSKHFIVRIPNEHTEQFKVMSVAYSSANSGEPVTVVVKGDYFSPQIGVLVDGAALNRSLSVGNTETSDAGADNSATTGVRGQYELVSSHELVMKFSMVNDKYVGTPNITLVTPENSTAINYLPLQINYHYPKTSLRNLASTEPMFIEAFSLTKTVEPSGDGKFSKARLTGAGLRRDANIWINDHLIPAFKPGKWKLIKEVTDELKGIGERDLELLKEILYELLAEQTEVGAGHVDQMIADTLIRSKMPLILQAQTALTQIERNYPDKDLPERELVAKVKADKKSYDPDIKRAIFSAFIHLSSPDFASLARNADEQSSTTLNPEDYKKALQEAATDLYMNRTSSELRDELTHEYLIRSFAFEYADRVCLKNGVRGTECTEASRRKLIQRRLQELVSDNVDPFHTDEPYHNEELYQELKELLLGDLILARRVVVRKAIDDKKNGQESETTARKNLVDALANSYLTEHVEDCKKAKTTDEKSCKDKLENDRKEQLKDYETLYEASKTEWSVVYERLLRSIKRKRFYAAIKAKRPDDFTSLLDPIKKLPNSDGSATLSHDDDELEKLLNEPLPSGFDEANSRNDALDEIARMYERPADDEEYASQESTKAYTVNFLNNGKKSFDIRYKQKTSNSFNADNFSKKADDSPYKIVHYTPNVGGNAALVDISFSVDKDKPPTIDVLHSSIAHRAEDQIQEKPGKIRVSFYVSYETHGKGKAQERDHFWVKLTPKEDANAPAKETGNAGVSRVDGRQRNGNATQAAKNKNTKSAKQPADDKTKDTYLDIELPLRPVITAITINKPAIPDDSTGSQIIIEGINLQNVQKVVVAGQDADIVGTPDKNSVTVTLKKGVFIKEEDGVKIPVSLTSKDGTTVTAVLTIAPPEKAPAGKKRKSTQSVTTKQNYRTKD